MPYLDELYSPEQAPATAQVEGGGWGDNLRSAIEALRMRGGWDDSFASQTANKLAAQPAAYINNVLREHPRFAQDLQMQNYLAPLEHQARIAENMRGGEDASTLAGFMATAASPGYDLMKLYGGREDARSFPQDVAQQLVQGVGNRTTVTSDPQVEAQLRAFRGFGEGALDRIRSVWGNTLPWDRKK